MIVICVPLARSETISGVITGEMIVDTVVIPTEKCHISATQIRHDIGGYTNPDNSLQGSDQVQFHPEAEVLSSVQMQEMA